MKPIKLFGKELNSAERSRDPTVYIYDEIGTGDVFYSLEAESFCSTKVNFRASARLSTWIAVGVIESKDIK